ncbi:hypothetical protein [Rhodococcus opacus]|uniref:hypothetical protein n=1 Tax=Rhodococcus opacus TaxID=37919 RepID=UPI001C44B83A|nr:hypothetical protein [Rhodococcus opacus]MBV6760811.1 hypothetical protein [Rhodococcus opacus]
MSTIESIVRSALHQSPIGATDWDPLRIEDSLQECALLDVRHFASSSAVALLLDLRTALHLDVGNTALVVIGGVSSYSWVSDTVEADIMMRTVVGSYPTLTDSEYKLEVACSPRSVFLATGKWASFFEGNVTDIGESQPDLASDDPATLASGFPNWRSELEVAYSTIARI